MKRYKVLEWLPDYCCHLAQNLDTMDWPERIDFLIDGDLGDTLPEELVGKVVQCNYTIPFISLAMDPRLANPDELDHEGGDKSPEQEN